VQKPARADGCATHDTPPPAHLHLAHETGQLQGAHCYSCLDDFYNSFVDLPAPLRGTPEHVLHEAGRKLFLPPGAESLAARLATRMQTC